MMNSAIFALHILVVVVLTQGFKKHLVFWVAFQALLANIFVTKQITLFGLDVTASDVYAVGCILSLNLLQETEGVEKAKKANIFSLALQGAFLLFAKLHLLYEPNAFDTTHDAFDTIFSTTPRILTASLLTFFIVQRWDIAFFSFLKKSLPNASFLARTWISLVISQALDTTLFSFLGLYGIVGSITDILLMSFCIKLVLIFCLTPLLNFMKKYELALPV